MSDFIFAVGCTSPVIYMVIVIGFIRWYIKTDKMMTNRAILWISRIAIIVFIIGFMGVFTVLSFLGAFGPGAWLLFFCIPFTVIALWYYARQLNKTSRKSNDRRLAKTFVNNIVGFVLVSMVGLSPILGYNQINNLYLTVNQNRADELIKALKAYEADFGNYPDELENLIPDYISSLPHPMSNPFTVENSSFEYLMCQGGIQIVWYDPPRGGFPERYNLDAGYWSGISAFDGVCSYLNTE